ncbi:MAG: hypothetical protein V4685_10580 [Bacteroidota bacterium]
MKPKMLQLLMFFLLTSLFVSSKENSDNTEARCIVKCLPAVECASQCIEKKEENVVAYPFALAPGSYMFRY